MATSDYIDTITLGDSYELIKKLDDRSVDCIYTDIPYLYDKGGGGSSALSQRKIKQKDSIEYISNGIDYDILNDFVRVCKKVNIYIWCSKMQINDLMNYFIKLGCNYEILVWCKTNPIPTTNNVWLPDVEYCLYFREKGVQLNDGYELKGKWYLSGLNVKDKDKFIHQTIKPLELVERHLKHTTSIGGIVLDTFIGSGTTAVACKNIGRHYIGFEIDPKWCKIANDRVNGIDAYGQQSFILL